MEGLELLEHDMLYGEFYCYGGSNPYTATDLRMGVEPVVITGWKVDGDLLHVYGRNFTDWSVIAIDGKSLETLRAGKNELTAPAEELLDPDAFEKGGRVITVRQVTSEGFTLGESVGVRVDNYSEIENKNS